MHFFLLTTPHLQRIHPSTGVLCIASATSSVCTAHIYTKSSAPSVPFSFSSFVEACIYFQRLLYSAFYVPCFKPFYSPEHSQLSILSLRGRWIFLEVIIQGKETRPHYLIDFTSHLNEWYVCATSKRLLKWLT